MAVSVQRVLNCGDDVLEVQGTDANGVAISARGWVSATTHHYPPSQYDANGALIAAAAARAMTPAEVGAYALQLLEDQNPAADTVAATAIAFTTS